MEREPWRLPEQAQHRLGRSPREEGTRGLKLSWLSWRRERGGATWRRWPGQSGVAHMAVGGKRHAMSAASFLLVSFFGPAGFAASVPFLLALFHLTSFSRGFQGSNTPTPYHTQVPSLRHASHPKRRTPSPQLDFGRLCQCQFASFHNPSADGEPAVPAPILHSLGLLSQPSDSRASRVSKGKRKNKNNCKRIGWFARLVQAFRHVEKSAILDLATSCSPHRSWVGRKKYNPAGSATWAIAGRRQQGRNLRAWVWLPHPRPARGPAQLSAKLLPQSYCAHSAVAWIPEPAADQPGTCLAP
ncbi:hypothetical protein BD289DRAFT_3872 [Coniella lustricola]|uniref:Uncharacterized protein n=1 Tax=Coniella lustricola TaxID=2025994 RepID=A0A2T3ANV6_9PEZI|nr:hypothetical protein BD289DRAFT_3872 [Coniella lustricola]